MADFDPDAYLAKTAPAAPPAFDPDAYLRATQPAPVSEVPGPRRSNIGVDVAAGLARGAFAPGIVLTEAGRTLLPESMGGAPARTFLPRVRERGEAVSAGLSTITGAEPTSTPFKVGEFAGEVVGTLGAGPVAAGVARGLRAAPSVVRAIETGGLAATGAPTALRGAAARVTGGAIGGGLSGALTDPDAALLSAALGAGLPIAVEPIKRVAGAAKETIIDPLLRPTLTAENALLSALGGDATAAANALRFTQQMQTTPGFQPTLTERLVERGAATPTVAAMESRIAASSPQASRQVYALAQQRVGALEGQLQRVEERIRQTAMSARPEAQAQLRAVRDQITQSLAQERQALTTAQERLGASLPDVYQTSVGETLSESAKKELKAARNRVSAIYKESFRLAGDEPAIPFESVVARAGIIRDQPIQELKGLAPETAKILELYGPKQVAPAAPVPLGKGEVSKNVLIKPSAPPAALPPSVTLEQAAALNQALNIDYAALRGSTDSAANIARSNINRLRDELNTAIQNSNLSPEAKQAFAAAKKAHETQVAERFYTGTASKLLRENASRTSLLADEKIVGTILGSETGARDLLGAIGPDPRARQALELGIADLFRQKVTHPTTKAVKPDAAANFLQTHSRQLDMVGGDIKQRLTQVLREAEQQANEFQRIVDLGKELNQRSAPEVVDYALKHPANMNLVQRRLGADGQSALAREVADRALAPLNAGNADAAVDFLTKNAATAQRALGKQTYDQLLLQAQFGQEVKRQAQGLQAFAKDVEGVVFTRTKDFTPQQLTDLALVAQDLQRAQRAAALAQQGKKVAAPDVSDLATEAAQAKGVSVRQTPSMLSRVATYARNTWSRLEESINKRAAAELVTLMYSNPDAAIAALERAQARATMQAKPPGAASRAAAQALRVAPTGGAQPNQLAPESESQNALAR